MVSDDGLLDIETLWQVAGKVWPESCDYDCEE